MSKEFKNIIEPIDDSVNPVPKINSRNIFGVIDTIIDTTAGSDLIPKQKPTTFMGQLRIYKNTNTGTYRFYIFDTKNNVWKYTNLS